MSKKRSERDSQIGLGKLITLVGQSEAFGESDRQRRVLDALLDLALKGDVMNTSDLDKEESE